MSKNENKLLPGVPGMDSAGRFDLFLETIKSSSFDFVDYSDDGCICAGNADNLVEIMVSCGLAPYAKAGSRKRTAFAVMAGHLSKCPHHKEAGRPTIEIAEILVAAMARAGVDLTQQPVDYDEAGGEPLDAYHVLGGEYFVRAADGAYAPRTLSALRKELVAAGFSDSRPESGGLSRVDKEIIRIDRERAVDLAGKYSGYPVGLHEVNGVRLLATTACRWINGTPGDFPHIEAILSLMLRDNGVIFTLWLALRRQAHTSGRCSAGPAMVIVGGDDIGKTGILMKGIIVPALGGESAQCLPFLLEETKFNGDLAVAPVWRVDDGALPRTHPDRERFGQGIKNVASVNYLRLEQKYQGVVHLPIMRTLVIMLNHDQMEGLPNWGDLLEKAYLLEAHKFEMPAPLSPIPHGEEAKAEFDATLAKEMPHFCHYLDGLTVKAHSDYYRRRYGLVVVQDPGLYAVVEGGSADAELFNIIQQVFFSDGHNGLFEDQEGRRSAAQSMVEMTAEDMQHTLRTSKRSHDADYATRSAQGLARRLAKLAKLKPGWVVRLPRRRAVIGGASELVRPWRIYSVSYYQGNPPAAKVAED